MGLDMSFEDKNGNEICYFRKHSDLHGWLQEQWLKTNPDKQPDDFNCTKFPITQDILNGMKKLCNQTEHKHYNGFFWGESSKEDWKETKQLCNDIQNMLDEKETVNYSSSW